MQSVLFNLKTKQPSGAAGVVAFEVCQIITYFSLLLFRCPALGAPLGHGPAVEGFGGN